MNPLPQLSVPKVDASGQTSPKQETKETPKLTGKALALSLESLMRTNIIQTQLFPMQNIDQDSNKAFGHQLLYMEFIKQDMQPQKPYTQLEFEQ